MNIYFSLLILNVYTIYIYIYFYKKKKRKVEIINRSSIQFLNIRFIVNFSHDQFRYTHRLI